MVDEEKRLVWAMYRCMSGRFCETIPDKAESDLIEYIELVIQLNPEYTSVRIVEKINKSYDSMYNASVGKMANLNTDKNMLALVKAVKCYAYGLGGGAMSVTEQYPSRCLVCNSPAYIGLFEVECLAGKKIA